jgi:transcriptional regulator with XRE-family HTH domain
MVPRPDKRGGSDVVQGVVVDAVRFGRQIRALRRRRGWRQDDLATAAHVSRATIARVELGGAGRLQLDRLIQIANAMSARLDTRLLWNGEALDRLLDEAHATLVEALTRRLVDAGWIVAPEVSFSIFGERGSIDLLAFHEASGVLLVVEIKSILPDLQAMLVAIDRKARLAPRIALERGWQPLAIARLLVLPHDRTTRRRVESHAAVLESAFPTRGAAVKSWLRDPRGAISGLLFVSDVHPVNTRHRIARCRGGSGAIR